MTITPEHLTAVRFLEELQTGGTISKRGSQAMTHMGSNGWKMRDVVEMSLNTRRRNICRTIADLMQMDVRI